MQVTPVRFLGLENPLEKGYAIHSSILGLPWWLSWSRICLQCGRPRFSSWVGKIPWRRAWQSTLVFLPGESPWTEEPGGLQLWGHKVRHNWVTKHSTAQTSLNIHVQNHFERLCSILSYRIPERIYISPAVRHSGCFLLFFCSVFTMQWVPSANIQPVGTDTVIQSALFPLRDAHIIMYF